MSCVLFSIISPFFLSTGLLAPIANYYWSYRRELLFLGNARQFWFFNNWEDASSETMSLTLILMFILQVLTLLSGVASIFFKKRILSIAPVLTCLGVLGLMVYAGHFMVSALGGYQQGYYLVFPSLALFIFAVIINEVTRKSNSHLHNC